MIVVPCFNEATRLRPEEFIDAVKDLPRLSVLFVDDGSTDATAKVLEDLCSRRPQHLSWMRLERNGGKAEAVRRGMLAAMEREVDNVGYWDADLATPLSEIPRLAEQLEDGGFLVAFGSRVRLLGRSIERSAWRHYLGRVFATAASLLLQLPVYDTQCGSKLFKKTETLGDVFAEPFSARWTFDVEILARLLLLDGREKVLQSIVEVPLQKWMDVPGSKMKPADFMRAGLELSRFALAMAQRKR